MAFTRAALAGGSMLIAAAVASPADAAIWAWGCASRFENGEQILFNRYALLMLDRPTNYGLRKVIDADALDDHPHRRRFEIDDANSGFEAKMQFKPDPPGSPLVLSERSSKRISYRKGRVGPRDEITTTWRKEYRLSGADEKPRDITMDCMEYTLSTKGGRQ